MAVSTAALPSPRWLRQWMRTCLALGSAAIGWTATYLATTAWSANGAKPPLAAAALEAAIGVTIGLTGAAFGVRRVPDRHGAVAGMATLFAAFVGSLFLPGDWSRWPSPGDPRWDAAHTGWLLAVPITIAALTIAHRDTRAATVTLARALAHMRSLKPAPPTVDGRQFRRTASCAESQPFVTEILKVEIRAAGFVTGQAAEAAVDGLPLEAGTRCLDFGDDVASREVGRAGALLQSVDRVEDSVSAAQAAVWRSWLVAVGR